MLIIISTIPPIGGRLLKFLTSAKFSIIRFIGIFKSIVVKIPNIPAAAPTINVSALNTLDTSFFEAPIALKIHIYLVLSRTEI